MIKLKFKPDFDGAATALERASICYRNAGNPQKASKSLVDAAGYYEQNGNMFHAAKYVPYSAVSVVIQSS